MEGSRQPLSGPVANIRGLEHTENQATESMASQNKISPHMEKPDGIENVQFDQPQHAGHKAGKVALELEEEG